MEIEELAKWLHETWRDSPAGLESTREKARLPWHELSDSGRNDYLAVAERLLSDPPSCLREALAKV